MFSGTMRSNLDPYNEHSDMELWHVIKEANLMTMVAAIGGLEGRVDGSGAGSISLGQAQLVCLCRAALRKVINSCSPSFHLSNHLFCLRTLLIGGSLNW